MRKDFDNFRFEERSMSAVFNGSGTFKHSGILGQKWGRRRYQYEDGSLTPEGRVHYGVGESRKSKTYDKSKNDPKQYMSGNSLKEHNSNKEKLDKWKKEKGWEQVDDDVQKFWDLNDNSAKMKYIEKAFDKNYNSFCKEYGWNPDDPEEYKEHKNNAMYGDEDPFLQAGEAYLGRSEVTNAGIEFLKDYYSGKLKDSDFSVSHSGILGQKWGRRRYQYEDGSLTPEGRDHYGVGEARKSKKEEKANKKEEAKLAKQKNKNLMKEYKDNIKKDVTQMTDDELKRISQRQNLENAYYKSLENSKGAKLVKEKAEKDAELKASIVQGVVTTGAAIAKPLLVAKITDTDVDAGKTVLNGIVQGVSAGLGNFKKSDAAPLLNAIGNVGKTGYDIFSATKEYDEKETAIKEQFDKKTQDLVAKYKEISKITVPDVSYHAFSLENIDMPSETRRRVESDYAAKQNKDMDLLNIKEQNSKNAKEANDAMNKNYDDLVKKFTTF